MLLALTLRTHLAEDVNIVHDKQTDSKAVIAHAQLGVAEEEEQRDKDEN